MKLPKIFGTSSNQSVAETHPPSGGAQPVCPSSIAPELGRTHIYRHVTMDLETFDVFKAWERSLSRETGRKLTNSEVMRMLVLACGQPSRPAPRLSDHAHGR